MVLLLQLVIVRLICRLGFERLGTLLHELKHRVDSLRLVKVLNFDRLTLSLAIKALDGDIALSVDFDLFELPSLTEMRDHGLLNHMLFG